MILVRDFSSFFGASMAKKILWSSVMQDLVVLSLHGMATVDYMAASQQLDGFDWPIIMLRFWGIIPKWNYLRLVNYHHLPRIMIRKWTDWESVESLRFFSHGFIFLTCPFDGLGEFVKLKPIWLKQIGWNSDVILNEWQLWQDSHIFNIWRIFVFFSCFWQF